MPVAGGIISSETAPGVVGVSGSWDFRNWPTLALALTTPYNREAGDLAAGPDAQQSIMHRSWDPFDGSQQAWNLNLCGHPLFQMIEELYENSGTPFDAGGVRTYTRKFKVITKHATLGPSAVCSCPGIPYPYSMYIPGRALEYDLLARAVRISAQREAGADRSWIVTVEYSTQMPEGGPIPSGKIGLGWSTMGAQNAPWDEPPHLEWDPETTTKTPLADLDGKPFVNKAKQLIYPAPPVEDGVSVLVITKNVRFTSLEESRRYGEKFSYVVNKDVFVGGFAGQVLSLPPKMTEMYRGALRYWRVVHRLKFKKADTPILTWLQHLFPSETWQPKILNAGMYEIRQGWLGPDPAGTLVPIFRGGQPVNFPVPLTVDGTEALPGQENWLNFRYYPSTTFGGLLLPSKL